MLGGNPETREKGPDGQEHRVVGYTHVYRLFRRDILEYGAIGQ